MAIAAHPRSLRGWQAGLALAVVATAVAAVEFPPPLVRHGDGAGESGLLLPPSPPRRWRRVDSVTLFERFRAGNLIDPALTLGALRAGDADVRPIGTIVLPAGLKTRLEAGFPLALRQLRQPGCAQLFADLAAEGPVVLATSIYLLPTSHIESLCGRGAVAVTRIGQPATYLCPALARLGTNEVAIALLHEALHYAGLPERPPDPEALSSAEINMVVRTRCNL